MLVRNKNLVIILGIAGQCPVEQPSLPRHLGIALSADLPSLQTNSTHSGAPAPPYLRTFILQPPEIMHILNARSKIVLEIFSHSTVASYKTSIYSIFAIFVGSQDARESRKHQLLKEKFLRKGGVGDMERTSHFLCPVGVVSKYDLLLLLNVVRKTDSHYFSKSTGS